MVIPSSLFLCLTSSRHLETLTAKIAETKYSALVSRWSAAKRKFQPIISRSQLKSARHHLKRHSARMSFIEILRLARSVNSAWSESWGTPFLKHSGRRTLDYTPADPLRASLGTIVYTYPLERIASWRYGRSHTSSDETLTETQLWYLHCA